MIKPLSSSHRQITCMFLQFMRAVHHSSYEAASPYSAPPNKTIIIYSSHWSEAILSSIHNMLCLQTADISSFIFYNEIIAYILHQGSFILILIDTCQ